MNAETLVATIVVWVSVTMVVTIGAVLVVSDLFLSSRRGPPPLLEFTGTLTRDPGGLCRSGVIYELRGQHPGGGTLVVWVDPGEDKNLGGAPTAVVVTVRPLIPPVRVSQ